MKTISPCPRGKVKRYSENECRARKFLKDTCNLIPYIQVVQTLLNARYFPTYTGGAQMTFAKRLKKPLLGGMAVCLLLSALAITFVALSPHPAQAAGQVTKMVKITTNKHNVFTFKPKTITIKVGTTVTWTNTTTTTHTVTSDDGKTFNSGFISPGGKFSFTFTKAGTYGYHCAIHPFMKGTIIVK